MQNCTIWCQDYPFLGLNLLSDDCRDLNCPVSVQTCCIQILSTGLECFSPRSQVTKKKEEKSFYSLPEFEEWKSNTSNWHTWRVKYYKGLNSAVLHLYLIQVPKEAALLFPRFGYLHFKGGQRILLWHETPSHSIPIQWPRWWCFHWACENQLCLWMDAGFRVHRFSLFHLGIQQEENWREERMADKLDGGEEEESSAGSPRGLLSLWPLVNATFLLFHHLLMWKLFSSPCSCICMAKKLAASHTMNLWTENWFSSQMLTMSVPSRLWLMVRFHLQLTAYRKI